MLLSLFAPFSASPASAATATLTAAVPSFSSSNIAAWQLNGSAYQTGSVLRLTNATGDQAGSAFFKNRASLGGNRSFSSYFVLSFTSPGGNAGFAPGADGIVFALQTQSNTAGGIGSGIGYQGISPSVGIEFDTYNNGTCCGFNDQSGNHIGLDLNGSVNSVVYAESPYTLKGGTWNVWVDYNGVSDVLQVRMGATSNRASSTVVLTGNVDLAGVLGTDVYVGFTAATGGAWENHDVHQFYFNNDYITGGIDTTANTYTQAPTSVVLSASPTSIGNDNAQTTTLTATVRGPDNNVMANQLVNFTTNLGTLVTNSATTNASGQASVTFHSGTVGTATIRATAIGGYYADANVVVTDIVPPTAPSIVNPGPGSAVATTTPTFTGTATADTTLVRVYDADTNQLLCSVSPDGLHNWQCTSASVLGNGPRQINAIAYDSASNASTATTRSFTVDTVAPTAPVIALPSSLVPTSDATPTFSGTAEGGTTIVVENSIGTQLCTTVADAGGAWSCDSTATLGNTTHTVTVRSSDQAGNISSASRTFSVDTVAPSAPSITTPAAGSTTSNVQPTFSGTAEALALVTVKNTADDAVLCSTTADPGSGSWSCASTTTLADATYTVAVAASDAAGNQSGTTTRTFSVDTVDPNVPVILVPASGALVNVNKPTFSGTAEPSSTVEVRDGTTLLCSTTADAGDGSWSCVSTTTLGQGAQTVGAVAFDAAGNDSVAASRSFVVDSVKPAPVSLATPLDASLTNDATPEFSGTAEAGSTVEVREGTTLLCSTTADPGDGSWSCAPQSALADGPHAIAVTATDSATNTSLPVEITLTTDATAPAAATIVTPAAAELVNDPTPEFSGTAEANSAVEVKQGATVLCQTTADASGNWSCSPQNALVDGDITVGVWVRDAATNVSLEATRSFALDSAAPAQPTVLTPADATDSPDATPEFTGTAEAGSTITISANGTPICSVVVDGSGNWSCTPTNDLLDGSYSVVVVAVDAFANQSSAATLTLSVDTVKPAPAAGILPQDGSATTDTTPTFEGTSEPNATVTVTDGADVVCSTTADSSGNWSCTPAAALPEADYTFTVTVADAAGNTSSVTTDVTIDTTNPVAPVVTAPLADAHLRDATPTFTGTAEPGTTVEVAAGGTLLCQATADVNGDWSCAPQNDLADGPVSISVTTTDAAGNESSAATFAVTIDTIAPADAVLAAPAHLSVVADTTPEFSGTAEPGSTVLVEVDNTVVCSATADANGDWSCTPATPLAEAPHILVLTVVDAAGNGSAGVTSAFRVDVTAPAAPTVAAPGAFTPSATPEFEGTAEPNAAITVMEGAALLCQTTADASGDWSCTPAAPLAEGPHTYVVSATDAAGNATPTAGAFEVDLTLPEAPVVQTPGADTNDTTPEFGGTAEPGSTVTVMDGTDVVCTATADANGDWSCAPATPLGEGSHTVTVVVTDAAGNASTGTASTFNVDVTTPAPAVIDAPSAGALVDDATPTFEGTAEPGSTVTVMDGTDVVCETTADVNGDWSCTPTTPLGEGSHTVTVVVTDAAGNANTVATAAFSVDTVAPTTPQVGGPADGTATNDTTPEFSGTAEPYALIEVMDGTDVVCSVIAEPNGTWSCAPTSPLSPGSHALTIVATDPTGNTGAPRSLTVTVDTVAPSTPVVGSPADNSPIDDATPTFEGTAEPGSTVTVMDGADVVCTATADANGDWSCAPATPLGEGDHTITIVVTDAADNTSQPQTLTITVDTVEPAAPVTGEPADDSTTNDATPTFEGTAEPGSTVTVMDGADVVCTATADANGDWNCTPATPLDNGSHMLTVIVTDAAGNAGTPVELNVTIDTTAPDAPTVSGPFNGDAVDDPTPTFEGTAEPGSTVAVMDGADVVCTTTADANGDWSCTPATPLDSGSHAITVTVTDPGGSTSSETPIMVTVGGDDLAPPTINSDVRSSSGWPTITGTALPGAMVTVVLDPDGDPTTDNLVVYTVTAAADGTWTVETSSATPIVGAMPANGMEPGTRFKVTAVAADGGGRVSPLARQSLQLLKAIYFPFFVS